MSDYLLDISTNPLATRAIKALKLPIALPQKLRRPAGAWSERVLEGQTIAVSGEGGQLATLVAGTLARAGADVVVVGTDAAAPPFREAGEAWGRPVRVVPPVPPPKELKPNALVFDATAIQTPDALRRLYDFFHVWVRSVPACGRVVVLARPAGTTMTAAAASSAAEGFVRSLAKELGRRGVTANLLTIAAGAEDRAVGPLRYLLSSHSAFVTAQVLRVSAGTASCEAAPVARALHHKVALVTGAARGIGAETARTLAREGAHVVCLDRPGEDAALGRLAREIAGSVLALDITEGAAARRLGDELKACHGGVDIVVHNAGVTRDRTLGRMKPEDWDMVMRVNLSAVCKLTEHLLSEALVRNLGRIIVLSSVTGIAGNAGQTNYAASKAGLLGVVHFLAPVVSVHGITINAIAPGLIETQMTARMPMVIREAARRLSALGQGGVPADVAEAVTFLALPGSSGITGHVLRVCGGALVGA